VVWCWRGVQNREEEPEILVGPPDGCQKLAPRSPLSIPLFD
jgi:hypothetical protein